MIKDQYKPVPNDKGLYEELTRIKDIVYNIYKSYTYKLYRAIYNIMINENLFLSDIDIKKLREKLKQ